MVSLLILWNSFYMYILVEHLYVYCGKFCMSLVLITAVIKTSDVPRLLDCKWGYRTCILE